MAVWIVLGVIALYMSALFWIAWKRDKEVRGNPDFEQSPITYVLALAVYCTSWTYFGAVGTAVSSGWEYLPIYLGPAIVFLFVPRFIARIGDISQRESVTSLSDFLTARYGKSRGLAVTATIAAVAGTLPYIALQLKSVGLSFQSLTTSIDDVESAPIWDTVLLTTFALAAFVILFGAREPDSTKHNAGLMRVLAIEAVIKLAALVAVCILSFGILSEQGLQITLVARNAFEFQSVSVRFVTLIILSMAAIICLPRQFHVAIIERRNASDVRAAKWLFPAYLLITSLVVVPIALAGLTVLPSTSAPDMFVLDLPRFAGNTLLSLVVFLGGFSAATGMVIVSTYALSTMVTNDLVVPAIIRSGRFQQLSGDAGARLLVVKRCVIMIILLLAYGYYRAAGNSEALAQTGLLSFAAAIQFAPALIGAVYWRNGKSTGALMGLCLGMLIWAYTLFLPALVGPDVMRNVLPSALDPYSLFGIGFGDPLTHGVFWSLVVNIVTFVTLSLQSQERLRDRVQAAVFLDGNSETIAVGDPLKTHATGITPDGLHALAARFLTSEAVDHAFTKFAIENDVIVNGDQPADWRLVQRTERLLASALGTSSARTVLSSAIGGQSVGLGEVLSLLDHKTQAERFERYMLQSMLENIPHGISVVDHEQRLVAWNSRYVELFNYPVELLQVGTPIHKLIMHNLNTGWISGDPSEQAKRRIIYMRSGRSHTYERENKDGTYLRILGMPMPGGGYVTSFIDITRDKKREQALIEANELLETRVRSRTRDLESMTNALRMSREEAISANVSKTRFLAAASHDLLQPLNAARLFLGTLKSGVNIEMDRRDDLISKTDKAIQSADDLLRGLLDISRLDHGQVEANPVNLPLGPLLEDLVDEATPMAEAANIELRVVPTRLSVQADPDYLRSILRNFISNARRYTKTGGVLVGARRRVDRVRIEVWDTGPGIKEDKLELLFEEFQRLEDVDNAGIRGAGLGLSIAKRLASVMNANLTVKSWPGKGSMFAISCLGPDVRNQILSTKSPLPAMPDIGLDGLRVLCIDDELTILQGMQSLLESWGCNPSIAQTPATACELSLHKKFDVVIADLDLKDPIDGLEVISQLEVSLSDQRNAALLTAKSGLEVALLKEEKTIKLLKKPVNPEAIRNFLNECAQRIKSQDMISLSSETAS